MYLLKNDQNTKEICLKKDEFYIISSAVIEISELYHKPKLPNEPFSKKFSHTLQENDQLANEFLQTRKGLKKILMDEEIYIPIDSKRYKIFCVALKEIIKNYEYYEFQIITGFYRNKVEEVWKKLMELKI